MFSNPRRACRRTVSVRLTAWYSAVLVVSLLTLACLVYFTLASALRKKDLELTRAKLQELSDEYKDEGLPELRRLSLEKKTNAFFIRVADPQKHTLFSSPGIDEITPQILAQIERLDPEDQRWLAVPLSHRAVLEIANTQFRDGNFLQVGRSSRHRVAFLDHFRSMCAVIIFPLILLGICGGAFLARQALEPIHELNDAVHAIIATGRLDQRISPRKTAGELRELVVAFNQMLERIDALIVGMRGVLDNVAHDLRTPLTRLRGLAEMALQHPGDLKIAHEALADCLEESERVTTMLNTLMDISEAETGAMRLALSAVPVRPIVAQIVDLYHDVAEDKNIAISVAADGDWTVNADENRLRQAIGNLLDNALKYTPAGGTVCVETCRVEEAVVIAVRDSGVGIPREEIGHVWERLYRGDKSRSQRGLGLGLSLVKAIAQAHAGRCEVESTPGAGSIFRLHLPAAA